MSKKTSFVALAAVALLGAVGAGAWWLGMQQGMGHTPIHIQQRQ